ncbi:MAG: zinc-dependent alcohol dehydrogenase family protein [bacterium JZ-2024 1]
MKALRVYQPGPIETDVLRMEEMPLPEPGGGEVLVRVSACALCHTDLHIIEGELKGGKIPVIPGHQVIGRVEKLGSGCKRLRLGDKVGIPWLYRTCGKCRYCLNGEENLCEKAEFTGFHHDGGYAEALVVPEDFAHPVPEHWDAVQMSPLMCGGVIGYRTMKVAGVEKGDKVGLVGFGASAHLVLQMVVSQDCEAYVFTRSPEKYVLAKRLGAVWAGSLNQPPDVFLDRILYFAPVGFLLPDALRLLRRGGVCAIAAVHLDNVPSLNYTQELYWEKSLKSVANSTRKDVVELISFAEKFHIKPEVEVYSLSQWKEALGKLKKGAYSGAGAFAISPDG